MIEAGNAPGLDFDPNETLGALLARDGDTHLKCLRPGCATDWWGDIERAIGKLGDRTPLSSYLDAQACPKCAQRSPWLRLHIVKAWWRVLGVKIKRAPAE